jgi:hypothetical protein
MRHDNVAYKHLARIQVTQVGVYVTNLVTKLIPLPRNKLYLLFATAPI